MTRLREIAEAATPGPWDTSDKRANFREVKGPDYHPVAWCKAHGYFCDCGRVRTWMAKADAIHIATFDPPTVLEMLALLGEVNADECMSDEWHERYERLVGE